MNSYIIDGTECTSVELKGLIVSRGLQVAASVYKSCKEKYRLNESPLCCNCFRLSDGTIVQLTDMGFHLRNLKGMLSWNTLKLLKYAKELTTDFALAMAEDGKVRLTYKGEHLDFVTFPPYTDFYKQKTSSGLPFVGNAVLQGIDWVAFQCLWPCEFAVSGKPCQYCYSGLEFESLAKRHKKLPAPVPAKDMAEIVKYAIEKCGCNSIQITGGSTFDGKKESELIIGYLEALNEYVGSDNIPGEILLYITPPSDLRLIDKYFELGATKIACSVEVWDEELAGIITPGKIAYTTRERHLRALEYIAEKYGPNKAFSNLIIGLEPLDTLSEGVEYFASRGIIPTSSTWMPAGCPVMGSMKAPDLEYYIAVTDIFSKAYMKYNIEPEQCCGLNVCTERDIWRLAHGIELDR